MSQGATADDARRRGNRRAIDAARRLLIVRRMQHHVIPAPDAAGVLDDATFHLTLGFSRPRVLLAEDDRDLREMLAAALRGDGYDVVEASDGGRLLVRIGNEYLKEEPSSAFDLLISDVRMPVCDGLRILESLRQARWKTPFILMTAFGDDAIRERVHALGAAYFDKPFDVDDLRTAALYMLQRKRMPRVER